MYQAIRHDPEKLAREFADGRVRPATAQDIIDMDLARRSTLYKEIKTGAIRTIRVGRQHLIPADEVRRMLGLADGGESK